MKPLHVNAGELTATEILEALDEGRRVVVMTEMFGERREITLRHDGGVFYCDTPTRLHKHTDESEMLTCIQNMGYAKDDADG